MSEFLAEAQVLIRPNTATFAATLKTQLEAAVAAAGPVAVPVIAAPVAAGAGAAVAAETTAATAAVEANTAALAEQGAAATKAAAAEANLAAATRLTAEAEALLATASEAGTLKTTELAAARAVLAQTSRAVGVAEKAAAAAIAAGDAAIEGNTAALLANARAAELAATENVKLAIAEQRAAAAAAESAAAHSQVTRGIAAETLALTGLRGATLAASAPFLLGATAAIVFAKSIKTASDATEEFNKTTEVFGESADVVKEFADTTATSLGISSLEALRSAAIFGNLFRAIKISEPVAAEMSVRLVKLAADLASFNNANPERTLEALRAGLVGQARPLRVFGAFLTAARVQQEALLVTQKKSIKSLTQAELVQARFNLIFRDTVIAQGDVGRTSEQLANQSRILAAQIENLSESIGKVLLPTLLLAVQDVNLLIQAFEKLSKVRVKIPGTEKGGTLDAVQKKIEAIFGKKNARNLELNLLFPGIGFGISNLQLLNKILKELVGSEEDATLATKHLLEITDAHSRAANAAAAALVAQQQAVEDLTVKLRGLEVQQLEIQTGIAPGGRAAEEANLRQQIAEDRKRIALAQSGTAARKDALEDLRADQQELRALQRQDAADIREAAAAQQAEARKAAQEQQKADQALLTALGFGREVQDLELAAAQRSGNFRAIIREFNDQQALLKRQIKAIRAQVKDEQERRAAILALRSALAASNSAEEELRAQRAEEKQARIDQIQELNIQLAQERGNEAALRRAIQARLKRLRLQINAAKGDQVKIKQLRLERERLLNELEELNKTQKKESDITKQIFFDFLQKQQGFAANLLGNLIPGFATAGLVGGQQAGLQQAVTPPSRALSEAAAVTQVQGAGITRGQGDTQLAILRQIRDALFTLTGRTAVPEARYQRATQSAFMDVIGT